MEAELSRLMTKRLAQLLTKCKVSCNVTLASQAVIIREYGIFKSSWLRKREKKLLTSIRRSTIRL